MSETWDQSGSTFGDEFPYIEISAVSLGIGDYEVQFVPTREAPSRAKMIVRSGDFIVSSTRPHRGAIAIIKQDHDGFIASTGFAVLRQFAVDIEPEFLFYALTSRPVLNQFLQRSSGGNYPAITLDEVALVNIPIPPSSIRSVMVREMVEAHTTLQRKIEAAGARILELNDLILSQLGLLDNVKQFKSVFAIKKSQIDGPVNPERYRGLALEKGIIGTVMSEVIDFVQDKVAPSRVGPGTEWDWIRIDDMENQPVEFHHPRAVLGRDISGSFFKVEENDVLIARLGPTILNRKFTLCPPLKRQTVASSEFLVLRCRKGWDPLVLLWVLRTSLYRDLIYSKARGATPSRYRVNSEDFAKLPLPIIDEELQLELRSEILRRVQTAQALREAAVQDWEAAKARFEEQLLKPT